MTSSSFELWSKINKPAQWQCDYRHVQLCWLFLEFFHDLYLLCRFHLLKCAVKYRRQLEDSPKSVHKQKFLKRMCWYRITANMAVFHLTLFIAAIALLAPFIPAEIEVPAYIAWIKNGCINQKLVLSTIRTEIQKNQTGRWPCLCVSSYSTNLCPCALQIEDLLPQPDKLPS